MPTGPELQLLQRILQEGWWNHSALSDSEWVINADLRDEIKKHIQALQEGSEE